MAKTFPIRLEVEEIALGAVLRKLNEMPGIAKLDLDLGHGGQGAGRKELENAAAANAKPIQERVAEFLVSGPKHVREVAAHIGGRATRSYGALSNLKKAGIVQKVGKGQWALSKKAHGALTPIALPAPKIERSKSGRAAPGAGPIALRSVLANGSLSPSDLYARLGEAGMSSKGISGVIKRARENGILKKNGDNLYELTARGQKIEVAHG